jgi:hypothetical protein
LNVTKFAEDGRVYAQYDYGDGPVVVEKSDPLIVHDAPAIVAAGSSLTITFRMIDFDGEARADSDGSLLLGIAGTKSRSRS